MNKLTGLRSSAAAWVVDFCPIPWPPSRTGRRGGRRNVGKTIQRIIRDFLSLGINNQRIKVQAILRIEIPTPGHSSVQYGDMPGKEVEIAQGGENAALFHQGANREAHDFAVVILNDNGIIPFGIGLHNAWKKHFPTSYRNGSIFSSGDCMAASSQSRNKSSLWITAQAKTSFSLEEGKRP